MVVLIIGSVRNYLYQHGTNSMKNLSINPKTAILEGLMAEFSRNTAKRNSYPWSSWIPVALPRALNPASAKCRNNDQPALLEVRNNSNRAVPTQEKVERSNYPDGSN